MASFTSVGDTTSLTVPFKGDVVSVALSGTYNMTIALQTESGSPGQGAWETIKEWSTANATVAYNYTTVKDNQNLRLIVTVDTSGTCVATLTDTNDQLMMEEFWPNSSIVRARWYQSGPVFYNGEGTTVADLRVGGSYVLLGDATAYSVLAANNRKTHLFPDFTSSCTATLPSPVAGMEFEFQYAGGAADAQNFIISTGSDTNYFVGGVTHLDSDAGAGTDELVPVYPDGNSNSKFTIVTPGAGTQVRFISNGTLWYISGLIVSASVCTFADQ